MVKEKDIQITVAGHTCLDLIPQFNLEDLVDNVGDVLAPGKMIDMDKCVVVGGGPVTNAGVSIRRLGINTELIGKVGKDEFGDEVIRWYEKNEGHFEGIKQVEGESTSYTIAICLPGIDRFYLHHRGANNTFCYDDMNWDIVGRSKMMLFGYPPWMKARYENTGAGLTKILKETKRLDTTTVLDLSLPDVKGYGDKIDWKAILEEWVPNVDIMVPSVEELFYFLKKERYLGLLKSGVKKEEMLNHITTKEISEMADYMINELHTGIALIKCGEHGLYIRTGNKDRLSKMGAAKPGDYDNWANRELFMPTYVEDSFVGALGSGDSAIAGFLAAFSKGYRIEDCLRCANAAGSMNVTVPDGLTWNTGGFDALLDYVIRKGTETYDLNNIKPNQSGKGHKREMPGWFHDTTTREFWVGRANKGKGNYVPLKKAG